MVPWDDPIANMLAGAFGVDFSSLEEEKVEEDLKKVSRGLLMHGVTAYCPTLVTSSKDYYHRILPLISPKTGGGNGAAILGKPWKEARRYR